MEWVDVENTVKLTMEGGEYNFPLNITPWEILCKYAIHMENDLYASTYAIYNNHSRLPQNTTIGELITHNFIREGDTLSIGPEEEALL